MKIVRTSNPNIFSTQQAADYLGLSEKTLANWRSSGRAKIPFVKLGVKVIYRKTDLDAWLDRNTRTHT